MSIGTRAVTVLAQASGTEETETVGIWDNRLLDEWTVPFGDWVEQAVFWIANNLKLLLDIVAWPFDTLIRLLVRDFLSEVSWLWVVMAMFAIAWLARNVKVASFVAVALFICGVLGGHYWLETVRTIGFILVAVVICVLIGIPVGIVCGRVDSFWQVVRPILDAMQVVHAFVYMLPIIWFFGVGETSATMVTMVFAIPPLIRLTNLGIRQVPGDVVEASRAYGAREMKVLFDVQIPLARPAIMTGVNQTLLLAISMLGIAAIMGAGGLGQTMFRAISNQDAALGASSGLAFFLVAVVLDRMSQREGAETGGLLKRIRMAWRHRSNPEALIPDASASAIVKYRQDERFAGLAAAERVPMLVTLIGGALMTVSAFLAWTINAGKLSAYGRWSDASLEGELDGRSFSGLDASGGSWVGLIVLVAGLFVVGAVAASYFRPGRGPRWLVVDGALIAAIAGLILSVGHLLARPLSATDTPVASGVADPGTGIGVIVATLGGVIAVVGAVGWIRTAPHSPLHPLPVGVAWSRLIGVGIAILVLAGGMFSSWSHDRRGGQIVTPEIQAELDEIERQMEERPQDIAALSTEYQITFEKSRIDNLIVTDGITGKGTGLGLWAFLVGLAAAATTLPAAGVFGSDERRKWQWSTITAGLGAGSTALALTWILVQVRSAEPGYLSGVGSLMALIAGAFVVASTMPVLKEFRRSKVYAALATGDDSAGDDSEAQDAPVAGASGPA